MKRRKRTYNLINLMQIDPEAREIAVKWVENFEPDGGIDLANKHKLASDIMNYANYQTEDVLIELIDKIDMMIEKSNIQFHPIYLRLKLLLQTTLIEKCSIGI